MNFRSITELNRDVTAHLHLIPRDVDVIVGIARSGMVPASLIALALNLPLAEMRGFAEGRLFGVGHTRKVNRNSIEFADLRHALVIDDSIDTGGSLREARAALNAVASQKKITFCCIYGAQPSHPEADITFVHLPRPRIFEWNVLHHAVLATACVDIDGVLCVDPTDTENDDEHLYLNFLREARPLTIPTKKIGTLVTSRLEKYRAETEGWLKAHGVEYDKLIMLNLPSAKERRRLGVHGSFKGEYYRKSDAVLFIESELRQAAQIANISGKPVLSIEGPVMCHPDLSIGSIVKDLQHAPGPKQKLLSVARRLLGPVRYERWKAVIKEI